MTDRIEQLTAADFDEAMTFLNRVFQVEPDSSFESRVSTLYLPTDASMGSSYAIRRAGRIAAIVGRFPFTWVLGPAQLRGALIGGVSVDPAFRKQGLMRRLMLHVLDVMERERCQFAWLSGMRQRYRYYGFERGGVSLRLRVNRANLRHGLAADWKPAVRLAYVADTSPLMPALHVLHDRQPWRCKRAAALFPRHLRLWCSTPFAALDADDQPVGYAGVSHDKRTVSELVATDPARAVDMLGALMTALGVNELSVQVGPLDRGLLAALTPLAESVTQESAGNWRIFDWPGVVGALLDAQRQTRALPPGAVVLGIAGEPRNLRLAVGNSGATCAWTDAPADLSASPMQMIQLLGGPCQPSFLQSLPPAAALLDAWCPLPLMLPTQDHG